MTKNQNRSYHRHDTNQSGAAPQLPPPLGGGGVLVHNDYGPDQQDYMVPACVGGTPHGAQTRDDTAAEITTCWS